jgi:hypothetical protein
LNTIIAGFLILALLVLLVYMLSLAARLVKAVEEIATQNKMAKKKRLIISLYQFYHVIFPLPGQNRMISGWGIRNSSCMVSAFAATRKNIYTRWWNPSSMSKNQPAMGNLKLTIRFI